MDSSAAWKRFSVVMVSCFLIGISTSFAVPALPKIAGAFNQSIANVTWISLVMYIAMAGLQPILGKFSDLKGRKLGFLIGVGSYVLGAVICALSPNFAILLFGRFLAGIGIAGTNFMAIATVGDCFQPTERGKPLGYYMVLAQLGAVISPFIGGIIVDAVGWRAPFWAAAALGGLSFIIFSLTREIKPQGVQQGFDVVGSSTLLVLTSLIIATPTLLMQKVSPISLGLLGAMIAFTLLFGLIQKRSKNPMVNLSDLKSKTFIMPVIMILLTMAPLQGLIYSMSFFVQQAQLQNAKMASYTMMALLLAMAAASFMAGSLADKYRPKHLLLFGMVLMTAGIFGYIQIRVESSLTYILMVMGVTGFGIGLNVPVVSRLVIFSAPPEKMGVISGFYGMFKDIAGPVGLAFLGAIFGVQTALQGKQILIAKAAAAGANSGLLETLQKVGMKVDPGTSAQLAALGIDVKKTLLYSSSQGMQGAVHYIGWIMLIVAIVGILFSFFIPDPKPVQQARREPNSGKSQIKG